MINNKFQWIDQKKNKIICRAKKLEIACTFETNLYFELFNIKYTKIKYLELLVATLKDPFSFYILYNQLSMLQLFSYFFLKSPGTFQLNSLNLKICWRLEYNLWEEWISDDPNDHRSKNSKVTSLTCLINFVVDKQQGTKKCSRSAAASRMTHKIQFQNWKHLNWTPSFHLQIVVDTFKLDDIFSEFTKNFCSVSG